MGEWREKSRQNYNVNQPQPAGCSRDDNESAENSYRPISRFGQNAKEMGGGIEATMRALRTSASTSRRSQSPPSPLVPLNKVNQVAVPNTHNIRHQKEKFGLVQNDKLKQGCAIF